jgi:hypothetical protein
MRGNNNADEVEANVERQRRKQSKMDAKARAMANKMNKLDMAMETTLAKSFADLNAELNSFGRAKGAKLIYKNSTTAENYCAKTYTSPFPRPRNIDPKPNHTS